MKINGYCLGPQAKDWIPAIPIAVVFDGQILDRNGEPVDIAEKVIIPIGPPMNPEYFEIPDNQWIGIGSDRKCVILNAEEEPKWRVAQAAMCIEKASRNSTEKSFEDTIRNVNMLHAAATLVGIKISELFSALSQARKTPNEPLEVTVRTIRDKLVNGS